MTISTVGVIGCFAINALSYAPFILVALWILPRRERRRAGDPPASAPAKTGSPLAGIRESLRDPRVTRIGGVLRRTRIDELPQLFNVLSGDMSVVGPRPERPHFVDQLADAIPFYHDRATVKPGITGWAQVNYPYGASIEDARQKLSYDLYYVKRRSLFLDLLILIGTVRVILFQEGAR